MESPSQIGNGLSDKSLMDTIGSPWSSEWPYNTVNPKMHVCAKLPVLMHITDTCTRA